MASAATASPPAAIGGNDVTGADSSTQPSILMSSLSPGPDPTTLDSPDVPGDLLEPKTTNQIDILVSREDKDARGIQGLYHSSLLDSMLVSMFAFTTVFDGWLKRDARVQRSSPNEVQRILRESIVNPLRERGFVGAKKVVALQLALQKAAELPTRFLVEEIDLKAFLETLLYRGLGVEEPLCNLVYWHSPSPTQQTNVRYKFLSTTTIKNVYALETKLDFDDRVQYVTTRQLLERESMREGWKLLAAPRALLLVLERMGGAYGEQACCMPLPEIDITDCVASSQRNCHRCRDTETLAELECKECYEKDDQRKLLSHCTFCRSCAPHHARQNQQSRDDDGHNGSNDLFDFGQLACDAKMLIKDLQGVTKDNAALLGGLPVAGRNVSLQAGLVGAGLPLAGLLQRGAQAERSEDTDTNAATPALCSNMPAPSSPDSASAHTGGYERIQLELAAVVCKELFSYVAYVRTSNNQWIYYSCAETVDESPGGVVNRPIMKVIPDFDVLISEDQILKAGGNIPNDPENRHQHRVLHKSYAYLYRTPTISPHAPAGAGQQLDEASNDVALNAVEDA